MRAPGLVLGGLYLAAGAAAQPAAPQLPPDIVAHLPRDLRSYYLAFLVAPAQARPMSRALLIRHQDYMRGRIEAGAYHLIGHLDDNSRIAGMVIVSAGSPEEARAMVAADPIVSEGVLDVEVHPVTLPSLATLRVEYPPRQ